MYNCCKKKRIPRQDSYFFSYNRQGLIRLNNVILYYIILYLHNFITIVTTTTIDVL